MIIDKRDVFLRGIVHSGSCPTWAGVVAVGINDADSRVFGSAFD